MLKKIKTFVNEVTDEFNGIHFVYEDLDTFSNLVSCTDVNSSGIKRFTPSPLALEAIRFIQSDYSSRRLFGKSVRYSGTPPAFKKYIIPTGVAHSPPDWCGEDGSNNPAVTIGDHNRGKAPAFFYLNKRYLTDLQSGRAFILFDQSHEGYQTEWLWDWFHNCCRLFDINPRQVIYATGNLESEKQYEAWANSKNLVDRMLVLSYPHFESVIHFNAVHHSRELFDKKNNLPSFTDQVNYKAGRLLDIKAFNALQKRPRVHRIWFFKYLWAANLIKDGIISMNAFEFHKSYYEGKTLMPEEYEALEKMLPLMPPENPNGYNLSNFADGDCGNYLTAFNEQTMLDTWLTVVSEASFSDEEQTCFISEKTFKPIACCHPFVITGNKHSLKNLKELGYKTFHPYIDETYDDLPTWERFEAIITTISKIRKMTPEEKLEWYYGMKDILEHNRNTFYKNCEETVPGAFTKLLSYVKD
jgi:hypothetical protein